MENRLRAYRCTIFYVTGREKACTCIWDRMSLFIPIRSLVFMTWIRLHGQSIPVPVLQLWKNPVRYSQFLMICRNPVSCVKRAECVHCTFLSFRLQHCSNAVVSHCRNKRTGRFFDCACFIFFGNPVFVRDLFVSVLKFF